MIFFLREDGLSTSRYYSNDGIHMSHSGIKRLVGATNTSTKLVVEYQLCTFGKSKTLGVRNQQPPIQSRRMNVGKLFSPVNRNQPKGCAINHGPKPVSSFGNSRGAVTDVRCPATS